MKKIFMFTVLSFLLLSCGDDRGWKIDQVLVDQIKGEWFIERVSVVTDSTSQDQYDVGRINFGDCSLKDQSECEGWIEVDGITNTFTYRPDNWQSEEAPNEISIFVQGTPPDNNPLGEAGTYKIFSLEGNTMLFGSSRLSTNQQGGNDFTSMEIQLLKQ